MIKFVFSFTRQLNLKCVSLEQNLPHTCIPDLIHWRISRYIEDLKNSFYSAAQEIDFEQRKAAAKVGGQYILVPSFYFYKTHQKINGWVEKKTRNKIKDLIDPSMFDQYTAFVLINAIYFKATWKYQFVKSKTGRKLFFPESESLGLERKKVWMMDLTEKLEFANLPSFESKMVRLPYEGDRIVFDILLPNQKISKRRLHRYICLFK